MSHQTKQPVEKEAIEIVKPPQEPIVIAQPVVQALALEPLLFVELIFRIPTLTFRCTPLFKM